MTGKSIKTMDRQFILAEGTLIGTAIGAGTFGLPYVAAKAGFFPVMLMFALLGIITIYSNLMYGEISLRTRKNYRLTGYAEKYLGKSGKNFAALMIFLSLYASVLVYIILGGIFLNLLLSPFFGGNEFIYGIVIFVFASVCSYFNLNLFAAIESWMVAAMLCAMAMVVGGSAPHMNTANLMTYNPSQLFFPFGAILFSLSASLAIPEFENIMKKRQERIKPAILWGTVFYIILYGIFIIAVLGVTGAQTSEESLAGLRAFVGSGVITFGIIFGLLAVLTSHLVTAISLKEIFQYDYGFGRFGAWLLSCSVPFAIFVFGLRDFIKVITVAGGITGGFIGILIIVIFYRARQKGDEKPAYEIRAPELVSAFMIFIYLLGIIYEFIYS